MAKRVVIIGAGTAGLCAAKNALENGFEVVVYEQTKQLGGLWNYTDKTGVDEEGIPYGYMYEGLITNVPSPIMRFTDYDVPTEFNGESKSFLNAGEVLQFLDSYAEHFNVNQKINFQHQVIRVLPIEDGPRWQVLVKDLQNGNYFNETFDFAMICNGHHVHPNWPALKGQDVFKGTQMHSFYFRKKEKFQGEEKLLFVFWKNNIFIFLLLVDKRVLVVGSGPSAIDIAVMISRCATEVTLSHHIPLKDTIKLPDNMTLRPDTRELTETGAIFIDDSECCADSVIYCTGFSTKFPFLSVDCGIFVEENYVQPLYKNVININHPSMAIIGLDFLICVQMHFDIQSQFVLKMWSTGRPFPTREEMLKDAEANLEKRLKRGWKRKHAHRVGDFMADYYRQLGEIVDIRGMPDVYLQIFKTVGCGIITNYLHYRNDHYRVIDEENFEKISPTIEQSRSSDETGTVQPSWEEINQL